MITVNPLIDLTKSQKKIFKDIFIDAKHKYSTICSSRQFGKTYLIERCAIYLALQKKKQIILFIAPSHQQAKKNFDSILARLSITEQSAKLLVKHTNKSSSDRHILLSNDSIIHFRSAMKYDNFRGLSPDAIVLDEFAYIKDEAWSAISPTLAAKKHSKVIAASTPRGIGNLFHEWFIKGEDPNNIRYKSYRGHWSENPRYDPDSVADAKATLPEAIYLQEYEGQFIGANSTVFGDYSKAQTVKSWDQYNNDQLDHFYGIDWSSSKGGDSTVLTIMNELGRVVYVAEIQEPTLKDQAIAISNIINDYNNISGYTEVNGLGLGGSENLQELTDSCYQYTTTNSSKQEGVTNLIMDIENSILTLPVPKLCSNLSNQMSTFEVKQSITGKLQYSHRQGLHDDYVMSLMLANQARHELSGYGAGSGNGMKFYNMNDV